MTRNNIAILILIIATTGAVGYFVGKSLLGDNQLKPVSVEAARPLTSDVQKPSTDIFNDTAINPTTSITIGQSNAELIGD